MGKSLSNKYGQKLLDSAEKSRCNKNGIEKINSKTAEPIGDLIGNKIAYKMTSVSRKESAKELHNNNET